MAEYEVQGGVARAVLMRDSVNRPTDRCPFCFGRHWHGSHDGHKVAHCLNARSAVAPDGTVLSQARGYIVRTRTRVTEPDGGGG